VFLQGDSLKTRFLKIKANMLLTVPQEYEMDKQKQSQIKLKNLELDHLKLGTSQVVYNNQLSLLNQSD
jgi:hypothetical protein